MSTAGILNAARREAQKVLEQKAFTRIGTVTSVNPANYTAKVIIQPEGFESGWLPVGSIAVGDGWGFYALPEPGTSVEVTFQMGDWDSGLIGSRFFNRRVRPKAGVQAGEFLLAHKTGALLRFKPDGTVRIETPEDLELQVGGDLVANVTGQAQVTATAQAVVTAQTVLVAGNLGVQGTIKATGSITPNTTVP